VEYITLLISLVVILIYASLAFLKPRIAIYLLIFFSIFDLGFFSRWIRASQYLARIPFILAGLLALIFVLSFFSGKLKIQKNDLGVIATLKFIFLISCLAVLSCLYNGESLLLGLYELRYYYMLVIFVISFSYYIPGLATIKTFISFGVVIGLLQIPFTIFQYLLVQVMGVRLSQSALDMSSGTFASYSSLVFMQCVAIAGVLEYQLNIRKPLFKINNYFLAVLLIIPLLLSYSRSSMAFVIATVLFVFMRNMVKNINPVVILKRSITLVSVCFIFLFLFWHYFFEVHQFTEQLNVTYIVDYFMQEPKDLQQYQAGAHAVMGRGRAITEAFNLILNNFFTFFIGMGSGSSAEAGFIGLKGNYFYEYGPMAGIGRTQMSKTIVELGFLGGCIVGYFFFRLFLVEKIPVDNWSAVLIKNMTFNIIFLVFLFSLYSTILATDISMLAIGSLIAIKYRNAS